MPKTKTVAKRTKSAAKTTDFDSVYILKLVLYLIVGAQWLRIEHMSSGLEIPLPIGLIIGVLFAAHEHFKIDRKIEYALLIVAAFVGYFVQIGFFVKY